MFTNNNAMENQESMTAQESLELISRMIREAQVSVGKNSFYYLLWGWTIVIADIGVYTLLHMDVSKPFLVWLIIIPTWVISFVKGFSDRNKEKSSTLLNRVNGLMWMSFSVVVFIIIVFGSKINYQINSLILLVTVIPTFVSGVMLRFRMLMIGALIFLAGGIICFLVPGDIQFLVSAVTVICGFLIPGYMIKRLPDNV